MMPLEAQSACVPCTTHGDGEAGRKVGVGPEVGGRMWEGLAMEGDVMVRFDDTAVAGVRLLEFDVEFDAFAGLYKFVWFPRYLKEVSFI